MPTIILPIATVQPSFPSVIEDVATGLVPTDTFWISCYKSGFESVHAKVQAALNEVNRDQVDFDVSEGDVQFSSSGVSYHVACAKLGIQPTKVLLPRREFSDAELASPQRPHKITAFDVSPDGTQFASGCFDGSVHIYSSSSPPVPTAKSYAKAHLSTVMSLQFFPSSRVLLSAGGDFALSILPADPSLESASGRHEKKRITVARSLRGHSRGITSTAIVSRGRNVLSSSKDGTIRLWDVSSGMQIRSWSVGRNRYVPANDLSLGERVSGLNAANGTVAALPVDEREVETADKLAFVALHDGTFEGFDLRVGQPVFYSPPPTAKHPLNTIAYNPALAKFATGSSDGITETYDVRSLSSGHVLRWRRNNASIEDVCWTSADTLAIATEDGLPYLARLDAEIAPVTVETEIIGGDCDGVRVVRALNGVGGIWTAGDDGVVRQY